MLTYLHLTICGNMQIKLSEYIGKKYVVLFFYPLDFTFVCPTGTIIDMGFPSRLFRFFVIHQSDYTVH